MKTVGVKRLKARLSEYLRAVKGGETLLITERDAVVAELRPARAQPAPPQDLSGILDSLAESGEVTRAGASKGAWRWRARGLGLAPGTALDLLNELRGDLSGP